jgi:hypothetical protein
VVVLVVEVVYSTFTVSPEYFFTIDNSRIPDNQHTLFVLGRYAYLGDLIFGI